MLPEKSVLVGQKLVENAKIQKFKCDILSNFQTICRGEIRSQDLTYVVETCQEASMVSILRKKNRFRGKNFRYFSRQSFPQLFYRDFFTTFCEIDQNDHDKMSIRK